MFRYGIQSRCNENGACRCDCLQGISPDDPCDLQHNTQSSKFMYFRIRGKFHKNYNNELYDDVMQISFSL